MLSIRKLNAHRPLAALAGATTTALVVGLISAFSGAGTLAGAQVQNGGGAARATAPRANWELANKFGTEALRPVTYSATLQPRWIGKTDSMWYNWRDKNGSRFMLVVPATKVKRPLFDHAKLAAQLTTLHRKPYDPHTLPFTNLTWTTDHKKFRFNHDTGTLASRYEWSMTTETLSNIGKPLPADSIAPDEEREVGGGGGGGGRGGGGGGGGAGGPDFRNWSPDSTMFVFARDHNLYLVEKGKTDTVRVTTDGVRNHSFGFRDTTATQDTTQQQQGGDRKSTRLNSSHQ